MTRVMFVCHGNICRSPMAEFAFRELIKKNGMENNVSCSSSATSFEEIGNPVYPPARRILEREGIDCSAKKAVHFEKSDYLIFDIIVIMDDNNMHNLMRIIGNDTDNKVYKLMDFTDEKGNIEDPWYTGNFEKVYAQIKRGCEGLLGEIGK